MGKRITITEDEKKRILGLYEQDVPDVTPEEKKLDLVSFLKDNKFEEDQSFINSYQIKTNDNSFAVVFSLSPDKTSIKSATIVGPDEVISQMEDVFNKKNIPVAKTEGKLITRMPFNDEEVIKTLNRIDSIENKTWKCSFCGKDTYDVDIEYLIGYNHLECQLRNDINSVENQSLEVKLEQIVHQLNSLKEELKNLKKNI